MLVLLPPSEGKRVPTRGRPARLEDWPASLAAPRAEVLDALVRLCTDQPDTAVRTLGLGPAQTADVARDAALREAPSARADTVYSGVLYEALDLPGLPGPVRRRATGRLAVVSALLGLVRPDERIPAYRLGGGVTLPGVGTVAGHWRAHLDAPVRDALGGGLLVDLRSTTYAGFWRAGDDLARRTATVRVLHEAEDGARSVVSHFNKATKGRLVRSLLEANAVPRTPAALADALHDLGWTVERDGTRLDVVVSQV